VARPRQIRLEPVQAQPRHEFSNLFNFDQYFGSARPILKGAWISLRPGLLSSCAAQLMAWYFCLKGAGERTESLVVLGLYVSGKQADAYSGRWFHLATNQGPGCLVKQEIGMIIDREYAADMLMFLKLVTLLFIACGTAYLLKEAASMFVHML
jgi:hypothetical protein